MVKKSEKTIYFVRHGQSQGNVDPVFQTEDSPLSLAGRKQAQELADRVSKLPFDVLVVSPLQRAKETAVYVSELTGSKVVYSDLFVERKKPSKIIGRPYSDKKVDKIWRQWEQSLYDPNLRIEDGENFDDLIKRANKALNFLKERSEKRIVVVTHGYFLRTIVARVLLGSALKPDSYKNIQKVISMENTGITVLKYAAAFEEEFCWRLWTYNDHAHLDY